MKHNIELSKELVFLTLVPFVCLTLLPVETVTGEALIMLLVFLLCAF